MERHKQILGLIYDAMSRIGDSPTPNSMPEKSPEDVLFGESGKLDSLGIVRLILTLEESVATTFGSTVHLMDVIDRVPMTVATLAECIAEQIGAERATPKRVGPI